MVFSLMLIYRGKNWRTFGETNDFGVHSWQVRAR